MRRWLLILAVAFLAIGALVWPMGPARPSGAKPPAASGRIPVEEDEIQEDAEGELSDATYRQLAGPSACSTDCATRQAGFNWARDNDIENPGDCSGLEPPRAAGCRAYAQALQAAEARLREEADAGGL